MHIPNPSQIAAARALCGWTQLQLAQHATVGVATVRRFEQSAKQDQREITSRVKTLLKLKRTLEAEGVQFVFDSTCYGVTIEKHHKILIS